MKARSEYRDRDTVEVEVLDALVDRSDDGMTVFEIRSHADASIHEIEDALEALKADELIDVDDNSGQLVIKPADRVIPDEPGEEPDTSLIDDLRERLPF